MNAETGNAAAENSSEGREPPDGDSQGPSESADSVGLLRRGVLLGLTSAVAYSSANLALRGLSGHHDDLGWSIWVCAAKAFPTVVLAAVLMMRRRVRHEPLFPIGRVFPGLFGAALLMQFGGNLGFQVALGHIGLAITVPFVFAFIICSGAVLGRFFLGDAVSPRTIMAMMVMTVSIVLLSYAAWQNSEQESLSEAVTVGHKVVWLGIVMAIVSGLAYGINGVVIRGLSKNALPIECMLIVYSTTGVVTLGILGGSMLGLERLQAITGEEWGMMLVAGIFNAIAFFAITNALKLMNISHVNVINASQNAMCALAGIYIFGELNSPAMTTGIVLSVVGLMSLDRRS